MIDIAQVVLRGSQFQQVIPRVKEPTESGVAPIGYGQSSSPLKISFGRDLLYLNI